MSTLVRNSATALFGLSVLLLAGCGEDPSPPPPPTANDQIYDATENIEIHGELAASHLDPETASFRVDSPPSSGSLTVDPIAGTFTYFPSSNFVGSDSFTWDVSDAEGDSNSAEVIIEVSPGSVGQKDGIRAQEVRVTRR